MSSEHHTDAEDDEAARRRRAAASARGSVQAEGLVPTDAYTDDEEAYVAGTLTADELVARAEQRHRRPDSADN